MIYSGIFTEESLKEINGLIKPDKFYELVWRNCRGQNAGQVVIGNFLEKYIGRDCLNCEGVIFGPVKLIGENQ